MSEAENTFSENLSDDEKANLIESRNLAKQMALLAHDRHCTDVVIYELIGKSPVAKHFVIATGTSDQQIKSLGMEMIKEAKESETEIFTRAGMQQGKWIVIDLIDVVIHLFDGEYRNFYDLELMWGDAPQVKWERDEADS